MCAAIPVIKVLRESLVVTNVHRVLGIVNGTTNFILSAMTEGRSYADALAEAQRLGYAEADPTDDVGGLDAAAKMAILATVAFGSRVPLDWVEVEGIEALREEHVEAARALDMRVKLLGRATLAHGRVDVRVGPAFVDAHHPLAAVDGAFNAVMLQGDAIREITLEGPGAGGIETASAVVADLVSIVGTTGTGFLQGDPVWRQVERMPPGELSVAVVPASRRGGPSRRPRPARAGARGGGGLGRAARPAARERPRGAPRRDPRGAGRPGRGRARRDPRVAGVARRGDARCRSSPSAASRSSAGRRSIRSAAESSRIAGMTLPLIERFRDRLPVTERRPSSPSARARRRSSPRRRLARAAGVRELWLKWEASNPTGSYKDRGMTRGRLEGARGGRRRRCSAPRPGTRRRARQPTRRAPASRPWCSRRRGPSRGRSSPRRACWARSCSRCAATSTPRLRRPRSSQRRGTHVLVNSLNPYRRAGQKTAVLEIVEELGGAPDAFVLPYGGGGNTSAYAQALAELGLDTPIVSVEAEKRRETLATAIRIGDPVHAEAVQAAGARVIHVDDDEIVPAWRTLALGGGALLRAGLGAGPRRAPRGDVDGERLVVTITGHGLKDPAIADRLAPPPVEVDPIPTRSPPLPVPAAERVERPCTASSKRPTDRRRARGRVADRSRSRGFRPRIRHNSCRKFERYAARRDHRMTNECSPVARRRRRSVVPSTTGQRTRG